MGRIIGSVTWAPEAPKAGEDVLVQVLDPDGKPYDNREAAHIAINGVPGSRQYLRWDVPGSGRLHVTAADGDTVERSRHTVEVVPSEGGVRPRIEAQGGPESPTTLRFSLTGLGPERVTTGTLNPFEGAERKKGVHNPAEALAKSLAGDAAPAPTYEWDFGDGVKLATRFPRVAHDFGPRLRPGRQHSVFDMSVKVTAKGRPTLTARRTVSVLNLYEMAKQHGILQPQADYDLDARFDEDSFRASVTVHNPEAAKLELTTRQVEVFFADDDKPSRLLRKERMKVTVAANGATRFEVVVPSRDIPGDAVGFAVHFRGAPDKVSVPKITIDPRLVLPSRPTAGGGTRRATRPGPDGRAATQVGRIPLDQVIPRQRIVVKVSTYFDIPERWPSRAVLLSPAAEAVLNQVVHAGGVPDPRSVSLHDLGQLVQRGELASEQLGQLAPTLAASALAPARTAAVEAASTSGTAPRRRPGGSGKLGDKVSEKAPVTTSVADVIRSLPKEGKECDPSNLPSNVPDGLVCQATTETRWVAMPGRFMNARKGDLVLSPGSSEELIGGLLRRVEPPQNYSHSGIMTRNHDEVTHSTASEARLLDHPVGSVFGDPAPTEGHRPDVLKYLWPGVITQSVEQAVHGQSMADPETGKSYVVRGFKPNPTKPVAELIPPLVIKPDPTLETAAVRKKLHEVADFARAQAGKSHYRFFCYTDPAITLDTGGDAPGDSGWAAGTYPTVCSSFIWRCMRKLGVHMEGGIEPADAAEGAEHGPDSEEGLYLYRADERLAAGEFMYDWLADIVTQAIAEKTPGIAEWLVEAGADMIDDVANQILNTFASDWADTEAKDSDAWRHTTDARAVSPDNLLWWDGPDRGGLYGHFEPLVYRPPRYEQVTISRWRKVELTGTLTGTVRLQGKPVAGMRVQLYDGVFTATDGNGRFRLTEVPEGSYVLEASKVQADGLHLSASVPVTVTHDHDTDVDVDLSPPDDLYRAVTIDGLMTTTDDEFLAAANPVSRKACFTVLRVGPYDTHDEHTFTDVCDNDVRSQFHVEADWHLDKSVTITFTGRIYEDEDPKGPIDAELTRSFDVPAGGTGRWHGMKLFNCDDDSVEIEFEAHNGLQVT